MTNEITKNATISIKKTYKSEVYGQLYEVFTTGLCGEYALQQTEDQVSVFIYETREKYTGRFVTKNGQQIPVIYKIEIVDAN